MPPLAWATAPSGTVFRIGYKPEPLAWAGWEHATNGRFPGRWDDAHGEFRTTYLGDSLYSCLVEVLAFARKDPVLADELDQIDVAPEDVDELPTAVPGTLDRAWLEPRRAATAVLYGNYCDVTASDSIATLRPVFISRALAEGHSDFDAALLKNGSARGITQAVSSHLYNRPKVNGVRFTSRHGNDLILWCVFEQPHDGQISKHLTPVDQLELTDSHPELMRVFDLFNLQWAPLT